MSLQYAYGEVVTMTQIHQTPKLDQNTVYIESLACERRLLDAQKIRDYFIINNYSIVNNPKEAQYIILITCGFTNVVADICFDSIKKYKESDAELIVVGCVPETHKEKLKELFDGKTISAKELERIDELFPESSVKFIEITEDNSMLQNSEKLSWITYLKYLGERFSITKKITSFIIDKAVIKITGKLIYKTFPFNRIFTEPSYYYIMISRGCIHNCTYCIIRKAIGPLKSKTIDQCYTEFQRGLHQGYKTFVLEADDVGPYGIDIDSTLPELLQKMTSTEGDYSIEMRNTHPYWILKYKNELEALIKTKKVTSIFISIQSGSDRILHLMKRRYCVDDVMELAKRFKEINPDLKIGVDILLGFPSENLEDFQKTLSLFDTKLLDFGDIIPFSCHAATEASKIEPKVSEQEKKRRIRETLRYLRKRNYFALIIRDTGSIAFYARFNDR